MDSELVATGIPVWGDGESPDELRFGGIPKGYVVGYFHIGSKLHLITSGTSLGAAQV